VRFRYAGRTFKRSLKTLDRREAHDLLGRINDTLRLVEQGRLEMPLGAEPGVFILSDGKHNAKRIAPRIRTVAQLFKAYRDGLPAGAKHSGTDVVRIELQKVKGDLQLEIRDFGCGFEVEVARKLGFGLRGMIERVRMLGGECTIESEHDAGTRILVRLPLPTKDTEDISRVPGKPKA
jgi:signal transduction histidine kinase